MSQEAPYPIQDWPQQYDRILNTYAAQPSEELMQQASDLGHALFDAGVPPEDVVAAHTASVGRICAGGVPRCSDRMVAVPPPFLELMMAYGIGYRRQKSLIEQLGERTVELEQTIAERDSAEEALQLTQFTVDHVSDAVFWMDSHGKFFSVNEKACESLGYSLDELLKISVRDIDPDYPQERFDQLWKACRDGGSTTIESHHRRRDGHVFPVEITVNRMEYKGRSFLCSLVRDTTEREQAQDALRKARDELEIRVEERTAELKEINARLKQEIEGRKRTETSLRRREQELELITDNTPAFISYVDSDQRYQFVNKYYEKFFGRPKSEIIGHTVEEILGPPNYASIRKYIDLTLGGRRVSYQPTLEKPDGQSLHAICTYVPDFDKDGKVRGFHALIIDISARVVAEAKLQLKTKQLTTITDAITSFLKTGNWRESCATILRGAMNQTESEYGFIGVVAEDAALHILAFEGINWDAVKGRKLYEDTLQGFQQDGFLEFPSFNNFNRRGHHGKTNRHLQ